MKTIKLLFTLILGVSAQSLIAFQTQTVSGQVIDQITKETLPGANIVLLNHEPLLGTATDLNGNFKLKEVPVGRHTFSISFLGYENKVVSEVLVTTGREVILIIELQEQVFEGNEIQVIAEIAKEEPINNLAKVSAKAFTVEETQRYAGGLDDPARLVTAFAGVTSSGGVQTNAISIRGNAPKSVQWRLEGIEIPNPSHFAGLSVAGGGGLTLFSSQLLSDSDFMTGAFPAEYGNALSGVFDINFRKGNPIKREYAAQVGINGLEVSSGGPFKKGSPATYLFNYRFSTLTLLMPLLPTEGSIIYQDLSMNLDFPTKMAGRFSVWGVGGLDRQTLDAKRDTSEWEYAYWDFSNNEINLGVGAIGISHSILAGSNGYLKTTFAYSGNSTNYTEDQLNPDFEENPYLNINNSTSRLALKSYLNLRLNRALMLRSGVEFQNLYYNLDLKGVSNINSGYEQLVLGKGDAILAQAYSHSKWEISPKVTALVGMHSQWFSLNEELLIEPRAAFEYQLTNNTGLSIGYGMHSRVEELGIYYVASQGQLTNQKLKTAKAHHLVAGWSQRMGKYHHLKAEVFWQQLFDVPVIADSSFSMLNFVQDLTFNEPLVNDGRGENYGLEITLERFLDKGYYYLLTGTFYSSEYKGGDGVWRKTRFDQNIAANALFGKEIFLNNGKNMLGINTRISITGGERYSDVLPVESREQKRVIFDGDAPFNNQFDTQYIVDLTFNYRTNREGYSTVWALQIKNLLMSQDKSFDYNHQTEQVDLIKEGTILPFLSWKIEF